MSPAIYIEQEIRRDGPISFARFMELALHSPGGGYYERTREIGRQGDFFTSVSVGPVFGQLLAFQFAEWLEKTPSAPSGQWQLVEAGAHDGQLALDILGWLRERRPAILERLEYIIVEPSPVRRGWQLEILDFPNVRWTEDLGDLPAIRGVVFANELLDAMPVYRLGWDAATRTWMEWRVGWDGGSFRWEKAPPEEDAAAFLPPVPAGLAGVIPDGFLTEVCPAATDWWRRAAAKLAAGKLLTLDYGYDGWPIQPERAQGTLRAFRAHRVCGDLLARPGEQDLTADVNFAAVRAAGLAAGLATEFSGRQSKFLTEIFQRAQTSWAGLGEWTPGRVKQFQTLTHPEHRGTVSRLLRRSVEGFEASCKRRFPVPNGSRKYIKPPRARSRVNSVGNLSPLR